MRERTNCTIEEILAEYVAEDHKTCSNYLTLGMMANRSSIHTENNFRSFYILFGRSCALLIDCMHQVLQTKTCQTLNDIVIVVCLKDVKHEL